MELIDQHTKTIMEGCKLRARDAGLRFEDESLEYIVTNRDLIELSPKVMIPTLYDYWVHDVEVLQGKGRYELYPHNPYETVINTRPAISYYNDNNPDWLNVMIFYHVLGHIDFFQNNLYFRHTWDDDFSGQALADKRAVARLRSEHGRWVDYVLEFARSLDNLVDYHGMLADLHRPDLDGLSSRSDYYFDVFLQETKNARVNEYVKEIERYNKCLRKDPENGEEDFFRKILRSHPEFTAMYEKANGHRRETGRDIMRFVMDHSEFLNHDQNRWMKTILQIVRKTSLYFQPQIRTKIMNEGWASYWHETLYMQDDRIQGHEIDFARVNAGVTSMPRVGLNPYFINRYPHEFSGGQRQRVGIARALITRPDFVVADEPIAMADVSVRAMILELMARLKEEFGLTYLFITHDLATAKYICDRIAIMYLGQIMEMGSLNEVFQHPVHPYTQALLSAVPLPDPDGRREVMRLGGELPSPCRVTLYHTVRPPSIRYVPAGRNTVPPPWFFTTLRAH